MNLKQTILYWLAPETDEAVNREIDDANIRSIHFIGLVLAVAEALAVIGYALVNRARLGEPVILDSILRVSSLAAVSFFAFLITRPLVRKNRINRVNHHAVNGILALFFLALILWGMVASVGHYRNGEQMITFYTVLMCIVMFFKLRPIVSTVLVGATSAAFYAYLTIIVKPGMIQPYNYAMFILLAVGSAILNYRVTVNNIQQKNRIEVLNRTLEEIANHDSLTQLRNRYALNQSVPGYLHSEICLAMLDINKFKFINDTFGHKTGDEVLIRVADTMLSEFSRSDVFRYGGDEFLIAEETGDREGFERRLNAVNEKLAAYSAQKGNIQIGVAYGVTHFTPQSQNDFIDGIARADARLYEQKKQR